MTGDRNEKARVKQTRAVQMRIEGATYQQIADELGYASAAVASQTVRKALNQTHREMSDELRTLEASRLDEAMAIAWDIIKNERTAPLVKLAAIDRVIKIQERRTKYFGLDKPNQHEHVIRTELDAEIERLMAQLGRDIEAETTRQASTSSVSTAVDTDPR